MSNTESTPSSSSPTFAARSFKPGTKIAGCYLLTTLLYETSSVVVWLAHDDLLNRDVTLHFLPDIVASDERALNELRAEVKLNRQLIHPNTLRVYDLVEDVECAAVSMDVLEADPLSVLLTRKPGHFFIPGEVRSWLSEACQAMDDAHRAGLIHRGLSTETVLVRRNGSIQITAFGISRTILDALARIKPGSKDPLLASMSPQLLDGEAPVRSDDVYSFGALVFELLTGRLPFEGDDIVARIRKNPAPKLSEKREELKLVGEAIPGAWEKTVAACLEKSRESRPEGFREVGAGMKLGKAEPAPLPAAVAAPSSAAPPAKEAPARQKPESRPDVAKAEPPTQTGTVEAAVPKPEEKKEPKEHARPSGKSTEERPRTGERGADRTAWRAGAKETKSKSGARSSPFAAMAEKAAAEAGPKRSSGMGTLVALVLGVIVLVGVIAISMKSGRKDEKQAAGEMPPPLRTGDVVSETPAPPVTMAPAADLEAAQGNYEAQVARKEELTVALEAARQQAQERLASIGKLELTAKGGAAALAERREAGAAIEKELQEARAAVEAKARALEEHQQATQAIADEAKTTQEALATAQTEAEKARVEAERLEKSLAGIDAAIAVAESERARLASATSTASPTPEPSPVETATAAIVEETPATPALSPEDEELNMRAAEAQRAADEAAALAEQARRALEQADSLRKASEEARARARVRGPGATVPVRPQAAPSVSPGAAASPAGAASTVAPAAVAPSLENTLGMKFVPVGAVQFCIWQTRVKDYAAFAKQTGRAEARWSNPGFKQGDDHPVVNVSWLDAVAFCQWLTEKDQAAGNLRVGQTYRLPTDAEWSVAVGLSDEAGDTPEARDMGISDVYPWGTQWPPPKGAGNYTGEETGSDVAIKGYADGFVWTAPVGSFPPNTRGLYDLGGNVWEWCMDWWNAKQTAKVLRGASWYNGALKLSLLSSCRVHASPDSSTDNYGFRVVIADIPRATR